MPLKDPDNNFVKRKSQISAEDREGQSDFFDTPFEIPSFFRSSLGLGLGAASFNEPAFAQFSPPFGSNGMFADFLKTVGEDEVIGDEPFSTPPQVRTYETTTQTQEPNPPEEEHSPR